MRKRVALFLLLTVSLISACNLGTGEPAIVTPTSCNADELTAPVNLKPSLGETVAVARPSFTWDFSPDANCSAGIFHVQVGTDPSFKDTSVVLSDYSLPGTEYTPSLDALQDCTRYYWRVSSKTLDSEKYSSVTTFQTNFTGNCPLLPDCAGNLSAPELSTPALESIVDSLSPQLTWQPGKPECSDVSYRFEVSEQPDFISSLISGVTSLPSFETTLPYLEDCHAYYWRVTAEADSSREPSAVNQFWTNTTGSCPKKAVCNDSELTPPQLIFPSQNEIIASPSPIFLWMNTLPDCVPVEYTFLVSAFPDFSEYTISTPVKANGNTHTDATEFSTDLNFLNDCKQYYWKVILGDNENQISSDAGIFKTDFTGKCATLTTPFGDMIDKIRFDCVNPKLTVMTFSFTQPVKGDYVVYIGDRIWNCAKQLNVENVLICPGPWIKENVKTQITLYDMNKHDEILITELTSPICDIPN